jgi:hypothetical protein
MQHDTPLRIWGALAALVLGLLLVSPAASPAAARVRVRPRVDSPAPAPIGVHSMLYLTTPYGGKRAMFQEAAAVGASTIRLDVELSAVFPDQSGPPDWTGVDQYMRLAERYHLHVLADLLATPWYLSDCPGGVPFASTYLCPPSDPLAWGRDAGAIAAHTRGVIDDFEIINEPDAPWSFLGTPQQYAHILTASYAAIHAADPAARVAFGGLMDVGPAGRAGVDAVLTTPGVDAARSYDIANIHVRTPAADAAAVVAGWRRYFLSRDFHGPLWVTETGYPSDAAWQSDRGFHDGAASQAAWMMRVIPAMLTAGATMVFVTERDSLAGRYASEGILRSSDPLTADPSYVRRPSFYAVQTIGRSWAQHRRGSAEAG